MQLWRRKEHFKMVVLCHTSNHRHVPEISIHVAESNTSHNKGKHFKWALLRQTHPQRSIISPLPYLFTHLHATTPSTEWAPAACHKLSSHSLAPPKQITPQSLSTHFSNYGCITASNQIIYQTRAEGLSVDHLVREAGVMLKEPHLSKVQLLQPWWTWLSAVFLTLTDRHLGDRIWIASLYANSI